MLVFALSLPLWWLGRVTDAQLMPGLSVSALMAFCPMIAALLLVRREHGRTGVKGLLQRSVDFRRIRNMRWYLPILLLAPTISVVVYGVMRALDLPLPLSSTPSPSIAELLAAVPLIPVLLMFAAFFVGAVGEELGWSGYVLAPLQLRWSAVQSGLILGAVTVAWHLVPLLVLHRAPVWIAWWCLYTVAFRILVVWLFNNTGGSVCAVSLFHATLNLSYILFPIHGSYFDMRLGALLLTCAAAVVTTRWGRRDHDRRLADLRQSPPHVATGDARTSVTRVGDTYDRTAHRHLHLAG